jgi:response regulator RpfG family c-di-GMP phosphodiesterase
MGYFRRDNRMTEQSSKRKGKRRILAVDDNPDITLTLEEALKDDGSFEIDTFNDPELALSSFKPGVYDLALLDFRMPKMYGHELYDKIKELDSKVKVCFMSATYVNYEDARKTFPSLEIECFIQKPVKIKDLIRRINAELE